MPSVSKTPRPIIMILLLSVMFLAGATLTGNVVYRGWRYAPKIMESRLFMISEVGEGPHWA